MKNLVINIQVDILGKDSDDKFDLGVDVFLPEGIGETELKALIKEMGRKVVKLIQSKYPSADVQTFD